MSAPAGNSATKPAAREPATGRRHKARLAAVQALYQIDLAGTPPGAVIEEWRRHRLGKSASPGGEGTTGAVDAALFADVVDGAWQRRADIDGLLRPALAEDWTLERLETVLRAALRAAVYELMARADVPARVVINEYVDVAHAFFAGREPAFVNGLLDRLARRLRPAEFAGEATTPAPE